MYVPGQNAHEEMVSIVDHYKKRIAELEAENERLQKLSAARMRHVDSLASELADVKPDAERYRWLRDNPEHESLPYYEDCKWHFPYQIYGHGGTGGGVALRSFDTLDEAIDVAMEGE